MLRCRRMLSKSSETRFTETEKFSLKEAEKATWDLGMGVRKVLKDKGYRRRRPGEAPASRWFMPITIPYAGRAENAQFQIAAGVPLVLGEPDPTTRSRRPVRGWTKPRVDKTVTFESAVNSGGVATKRVDPVYVPKLAKNLRVL